MKASADVINSTPEWDVIGRGHLIRIFRDVLDLPAVIGAPILDCFQRWIKSSGPEWTIKRLKAYKLLYIQHLAGNTSFALDKSERIKVHKDNTPVGPFRGLYKLKGRKQVQKCFHVLSIYTGIIRSGSPTPAQLDKFYKAVLQPRGSNLSEDLLYIPEELYNIYDDIVWNSIPYDDLRRWTSDDTKVVSPLRTEPENRIKRAKRIPWTHSVTTLSLSMDDHLSDFLMLCSPLLKDDGFRRLIRKALKGDRVTDMGPANTKALENLYPPIAKELFPSYSGEAVPIVGSIGFIQERGGKLRAIANPLRVIQVVLSRFHKYLMEAAKDLPWDCTYDQYKGVRWVQKKLKEGHKLYSFDLSDASSTIPLSDQISFLKRVGPRTTDFLDTLRFFEKVSQSIWLDKYSPNEKPFTSWKKGQPLGILGSFPAFAQLHGARLNSLAIVHGVPNGHFIVLGDDVVVTERLAEIYAKFVTEKWGCDISIPKTVSSNSLAEFASVIITKSKLFHSGKLSKNWKFDPVDPLDPLRRYGKKGLALVPAELKYSVQVLSCLRKPVGLSYRWKKKELYGPDFYQLRDEFASLRKSLPNVAFVSIESQATNTRQKGGVSFIVRPRSFLNREQDLRVAFQPKAQFCLLKYSKKTIRDFGVTPGDFLGNRRKRLYATYGETPLVHLDYGTQDVEKQWMILHLNANIENDSSFIKGHHDAIIDSYKPLPTLSVKEEKSGKISSSLNFKVLRFIRRLVDKFLRNLIG